MRASEGVGRWFSGSRPHFVVLTLAALAAFLVLAIAAIGSAEWAGAQSSETGYQKKEPPLETPWTDEVGSNNALPEYPRPQMTRDRWQNLNGVWQFAGAEEAEAPTFGQDILQNLINQVGTLGSYTQQLLSGIFLIVVVLAQAFLTRKRIY
jgi:hypothetical protein